VVFFSIESVWPFLPYRKSISPSCYTEKINNMTEMERTGYKYIVGSRIKNEDKAVKDWVL
jgi:hypothetical protein